MQDSHEPSGFFPMPKFRFWATVALLLLSILSINSFTFATTIDGISILNWLSLFIMFMAVVAMAIDFYLDRPQTAEELEALEHGASENHE